MAIYHGTEATFSTACSYGGCTGEALVWARVRAGNLAGRFEHAPRIMDILTGQIDQDRTDPVASGNRALARARRK